MAQNAVEKVQKSGLYTVCGRRWEKKGNGVENDGKGWVVVTGEVVGGPTVTFQPGSRSGGRNFLQPVLEF